jgi:hypothetical protein
MVFPDNGFKRVRNQTRRFYASMSFLPLEEIDGLWPENPCLIMVKVLQPVRTQSQLG